MLSFRGKLTYRTIHQSLKPSTEDIVDSHATSAAVLVHEVSPNIPREVILIAQIFNGQSPKLPKVPDAEK